jgi:(1->4)-alpha-D-glucan 1-alpha-D-glucosylmutase
MLPRATYRIQFRKEFGFEDAADLADYLAELGISHVYTSPYLKARPNSTHGYDVTDHNSLNPDLGDADSFQRMMDSFQAHGLRHILDYVPNHMGAGGADNPLWLDVLEWGRESAYADWFDIDWKPRAEYLRDKVLVPFLAAQYGAELSAGHLRLKFDNQAGEFAIWAYDTHKLPLSPRTYSSIVGGNNPELHELGNAFSSIVKSNPLRSRQAAELKQKLAQLTRERPEIRALVDSSVASFHGTIGAPDTWMPLDKLIRMQNWRPAHFRVASDDINYRRFFNINELAGLRMELPEVFEHAHRFVLELSAKGFIDGLRIDHIDGLYDPKAYLQRLRTSVGAGFYLVVEKILEHHESLRKDWPIQGTTGYDFLSHITELLIDGSAETALSEIYRHFTRETKSFERIVYESKKRVLENMMASELLSLASKALRVAHQNPATADFTENLLCSTLKEIIACFPVYRTYVDASQATETDKRYIHWAVAHAAKNGVELDEGALDFLEKLLTCDLIHEPHSRYCRQSVVDLAMKVQQFSGPVMAKGFEDTALFRFNRFAALNEVGSTPEQFGSSVSGFHKENLARAENWPASMLATSTHDTKHGEDARARLAALSLVPEEWATRVTAWSRILRARRGDVEATAPPSRNDEYLFFQNLVATWPAEMTGAAALEQSTISSFTERLNAAMIKSVREARVNTNWVSQNVAYENAVTEFIFDALNLERSEAFLANFLPFQGRIALLGVHNSLVQTVLKLTSPGVPDFYQGCEIWDLSLVDPDDRRPVDFALRRHLMTCIKKTSQRTKCEAIRAMRRDWQDGRIKLSLISTLLEHRRLHGDLFQNGGYRPLTAVGPAGDRVCAFVRQHETDLLLVIVSNDARLDGPSFQETRLVLGHGADSHQWRDLFTGRIFSPEGSGLPLHEALSELPVAVLCQPSLNPAAS